MTWKKRLSIKDSGIVFFHHWEQFSENTAYGPHINSWGVEIRHENDFWCSIPTSDHMLSQLTILRFGLEGPRHRFFWLFLGELDTFGLYKHFRFFKSTSCGSSIIYCFWFFCFLVFLFFRFWLLLLFNLRLWFLIQIHNSPWRIICHFSFQKQLFSLFVHLLLCFWAHTFIKPFDTSC